MTSPHPAPLVERDVTTTTLEMRSPADLRPGRGLPSGARIERAVHAGPEFVRWLYATVGGPWRWCDRLAWPRERWAEELERPGSEVHVVTLDGTPAGYTQLAAAADGDAAGGTAAEILYFGLEEWAIGRGLGGALLTHAVRSAWTLGERHDLPAVTRVWVHTCDLDGPHAVANYTARGLRTVDVTTAPERTATTPLGAWAASTSFDPFGTGDPDVPVEDGRENLGS